ILKAVESLDPALLNMTVGEMLSMPVTSGGENKGRDQRSEKDTKENDELRTAREMTVENGRSRPAQIQETAVRPQANRVMELRTPAGNAFKMPSLITPRVGGGSLTTREIRPDEVAFSVAGSPLVMGERRGGGGRGDEEGFDQFHQLVNTAEEALSPTSREMVKNIKALMQRKAIGDPV
ncbi:hypothetical protein PENTCL1PPCAC_1248, partial [Pristionchus entomophagus]